MFRIVLNSLKLSEVNRIGEQPNDATQGSSSDPNPCQILKVQVQIQNHAKFYLQNDAISIAIHIKLQVFLFFIQ